VIALFLTFVVAAYLLGPDLVSRFVLGFVCPRKNIVQSKGEEITRAVAWAVLPFLVALVWARMYGTLAECAGWPEWKLFFAGAYSDAFFEKNSEAVFHATKAVFWWNFAILWRMYALVFIFWIGVDFFVYHFGTLRNYLNKGGWLRRGFRWLLSVFIIPRVSEWHVFLTNMLADKKDTRIQADILTKSDNLYQGYVVDKFLTSTGELNAIILADPRRFRREEYMEAKRTTTTKPKVDDYWVTIPSKTFIVMASEIVSVNLLHSSPSAVAKDAGVANAIRQALVSQSGHSGGATKVDVGP
jgi:hypothetical protein